MAKQIVTANGVDITYACIFNDAEKSITLPANLMPDLIIRINGEVVCSTGTAEQQREFAEKLALQDEMQDAIKSVQMRVQNKPFRLTLISESINNALRYRRKMY